MASAREESPFTSLRRQDVERMLASSSELGAALQQAMQDDNSRFVLPEFSADSTYHWLMLYLSLVSARIMMIKGKPQKLLGNFIRHYLIGCFSH
jgi:hypothetical protein